MTAEEKRIRGRETQRRYESRHRLARNKKSREYAAKNRDHMAETRKCWRAKNLDHTRAQARDYVKSRRSTNPAVRLIANLRARIGPALKWAVKSARTKELLGCSIAGLRAHLESKFVPGMTWENYGPVWHVDHKRPCASFDLLDPAQQRECFHFTNLQPLFALDNFRKGRKWTTL